LYAQLADYAETLERKVEAQTQALQQEIAERQQTEAALRQSGKLSQPAANREFSHHSL